MPDLRNQFEVLDIQESTEPPTERYVTYLHGLYLEGAEWDPVTRQVIETTAAERFVPFPAIRVRTLRLSECTLPRASLADGVGASKKKKKQKGPPEEGEQKFYRCPLFLSTLRLSTGPVSKNNAPVEYLPLATSEKPSTWTKRGVALVMEPQN